MTLNDLKYYVSFKENIAKSLEWVYKTKEGDGGEIAISTRLHAKLHHVMKTNKSNFPIILPSLTRT